MAGGASHAISGVLRGSALHPVGVEFGRRGYSGLLLAAVSANFAVAFYVIAYFLVSIGYGITFEWAWRGQTIGKRLLRLRVVDVEGACACNSTKS